jgi:hypothetical protein
MFIRTKAGMLNVGSIVSYRETSDFTDPLNKLVITYQLGNEILETTAPGGIQNLRELIELHPAEKGWSAVYAGGDEEPDEYLYIPIYFWGVYREVLNDGVRIEGLVLEEGYSFESAEIDNFQGYLAPGKEKFEPGPPLVVTLNWERLGEVPPSEDET